MAGVLRTFMDDARDASRYIPAEVRREVLVEAGHACAIPACQFPATEFAHIEPFAKVKQHDVTNIIALCPNHHHLFDQKKTIDRKAMRAYKLKLQFLNNRYTKYEMRLLAVLAEKPAAVASGEIEVMGLLRDELIENAQTFETQSIIITDNSSGKKTFEDRFVQSFAAVLTPKGRTFIESWRSSSEDLLSLL